MTKKEKEKDKEKTHYGFMCDACGQEQVFKVGIARKIVQHLIDAKLYTCLCHRLARTPQHNLVIVTNRNEKDIPDFISGDYKNARS